MLIKKEELQYILKMCTDSIILPDEKKTVYLSFIDQHLIVKTDMSTINIPFEYGFDDFAVNLATFSGIINSCKKGSDIDIDFDGTYLLIEASNNKSNLATKAITPEQYDFNDVSDMKSYTINDVFMDKLELAAKCTSGSDTDGVIQYICYEHGVLFATDAYRIFKTDVSDCLSEDIPRLFIHHNSLKFLKAFGINRMCVENNILTFFNVNNVKYTINSLESDEDFPVGVEEDEMMDVQAFDDLDFANGLSLKFKDTLTDILKTCRVLSVQTTAPELVRIWTTEDTLDVIYVQALADNGSSTCFTIESEDVEEAFDIKIDPATFAKTLTMFKDVKDHYELIINEYFMKFKYKDIILLQELYS